MAGSHRRHCLELASQLHEVHPTLHSEPGFEGLGGVARTELVFGVV
jgi:hypothetical protein